MIRQAKLTDINAISIIHRSALSEDLLPRLGKHFLETHFYPFFIRHQQVNFLVYTIDQDPYAFIMITHNDAPMQEWLKQQKKLIFLAILTRILYDPFIIKALYSYALRKIEPITLTSITETLPELSFIATSPKHQGKQFGAQLLQAGLKQLQQDGYPGCIVKTGSSNAKRFYVKHGFETIGKEHRGKKVFTILKHGF